MGYTTPRTRRLALSGTAHDVGHAAGVRGLRDGPGHLWHRHSLRVQDLPAGRLLFSARCWSANDFGSTDPVLEAFLVRKGALEVYQELTLEIKAQCKAMLSGIGFGTYSSDKVRPLLRNKYVALFADKGIAVSVNKKTVNLGTSTWREFTWIELVDVDSSSWTYAGGYPSGQLLSLEKTGWF